MARVPVAYTHMLLALDFLLGPGQEVVIAGQLQDPITSEMLKHLRRGFHPGRVLVLKEKGEKGQRLEALAPYVNSMDSGSSGAKAYLCENYSCRKPVSSPEELASLLGHTA